jgi:hypothetical protein
MGLQVLHAAAGLASPVIPVEDLTMEYKVALWVKLDSRGCGSDFLHEAFCAIWNWNSCCFGVDKTGSSSRLKCGRSPDRHGRGARQLRSRHKSSPDSSLAKKVVVETREGAHNADRDKSPLPYDRKDVLFRRQPRWRTISLLLFFPKMEFFNPQSNSNELLPQVAQVLEFCLHGGTELSDYLDLHAAIDHAANRVGRLLGQRLEKEKELTFGSEAVHVA